MVNKILEGRVTKRSVLQGIGAGIGVLAVPAIVRAQPARPEEVTLGALCALTGPGAVFGNSVKNAFEVRVEQINAAGGLWGDGKGMLKIVFADDQSKPDVAVSELARLARNKDIVALPSLVPSASTIQATIEAERQQISYINMAAAAKEINARGLKYTFSTCNNSEGYVQAYLDYTKSIVEQTGTVPQGVALVYENKYVGPSYNRAWRELFPKTVDWNLAGDYPYDPSSSDFGPLVARLKADKIDFPVLVGYPQDTILLLRTMYEQNYNPLAITGFYGALPNIETIEALGSHADYIMGQAPFLHSLSVPGAKEFVDAYKLKVGKLPDPLAGLGYNGFNGVLAAVRDAENPSDRDSVREALAALDVPAGQDGVIIPDAIRFNESGANPHSLGGYYQIRNGVHEAVLPAEFSTTELVYPRPHWDRY